MGADRTARAHRYLTMIVPCMNGWMRQMKWYVPGVVKSIFPDDGIGLVAGLLSSAPTLAKPFPCAVGDSVIVPGGSLGYTPGPGSSLP